MRVLVCSLTETEVVGEEKPTLQVELHSYCIVWNTTGSWVRMINPSSHVRLHQRTAHAYLSEQCVRSVYDMSIVALESGDHKQLS